MYINDQSWNMNKCDFLNYRSRWQEQYFEHISSRLNNQNTLIFNVGSETVERL